jgi:hypothetical protein
MGHTNSVGPLLCGTGVGNEKSIAHPSCHKASVRRRIRSLLETQIHMGGGGRERGGQWWRRVPVAGRAVRCDGGGAAASAVIVDGT